MHGEFALHLFWIGGAILLSVIFGGLAQRLNQPRVLGSLIAGLVIGTVFTGTHLMQELRSEHGIPLIKGLAEVAAMLLLFKAGLEGSFESILRDAKSGFGVAIIGIVFPMLGGFGYVMLATGVPWQVALFQGGVFAATSVGITAAVLGELGVMSKDYARTIVSAAVIDDVLGLIVLTVCSALNVTDEVNSTAIALNIASAVVFVIIVPVLGHLFAPRIVKSFSRVDIQSREAILLGFMFLYGAAALYFGLAAIVGAYFAGVALDEVFFLNKEKDHTDKPVEHFVDDLITAFGPIFFVYAGSIVDPSVFLNGVVLMNGLAFTAIAVVGKLACGLAVRENRMIIGVGMAPRGEVGIVFATIGLQTGVLTNELFGASMIMVLLTTMLTPPVLSALIARTKDKAEPTPSVAH